MSLEKVKAYFETLGMSDRICIFSQSSATVELAAQALGCAPERIAKTMSFLASDRPILIVAAGDARVDNKKYKDRFHTKAKMIPAGDVERLTGHAPGGVCPFPAQEELPVFLDVSLRRFDTVYPAAGSANSAVRLSPDELAQLCLGSEWVDVCRDWSVQ